MLELGQHAVDRGEADVQSLADEDAVHVSADRCRTLLLSNSFSMRSAGRSPSGRWSEIVNVRHRVASERKAVSAMI